MRPEMLKKSKPMTEMCCIYFTIHNSDSMAFITRTFDTLLLRYALYNAKF